MLEYLKNKKVIIIGVFLLVVFCSVFIFKNNKVETIQVDEVVQEKEHNEKKSSFYVDVKGAVKDPGVYLFNEGERVIDAIERAGGLIKSANTSNINLSKKLTSEMVVNVYTNNEVKKGSVKSQCDTECNCEVIEINNCIESNSENKKQININKASLEELMTLSGIGESKALAIIDYRDKNGGFETIEELKEVSGIGDALFERIKDMIRV